MEFLHLILISLLLLNSSLVSLSNNPVYSILFLILTFLSASSILILFNVEFLGILFIIIYVGAIAVLFLFVIMMLNVKIHPSKNISFLILLVCSGFVMIEIYVNLLNVFSDSNFFNTEFSIFTNNIDFLSNIDVFGQSLYNYYLICFLLAGIVLLIAMIGAIVLIFNFNSKRKSELFSRQISRSDIFSYFN